MREIHGDPGQDPIGSAFDGPWREHHRAGPDIHAPESVEADVVVVGTGAGGGVAAERLSRAGLSVIWLEEGPLRTSRDFHMLEREAYPDLYQEAAGRRTRDGGVGILQGRAVGGSTLVNWTTSFRTPPETLTHWREEHGLGHLTDAYLAPWFAAMEAWLNIAPWAAAPNRHNQLLADGAVALGWHPRVIARNVRGCWNLGYCGMGCPTNAKQSMLVTALPRVMAQGGRLYSRVRAERLLRQGDRVTGVAAHPLDEGGRVRREISLKFRARHVVVAAGAIGSPALLLRSRVPDPHGCLGRRTFLHPVVLSAARFPDPVAAHQGAPQSIYVDDFLWPGDGSVGFKLEVPPIHPLIASVVMGDFGVAHRQFMEAFQYQQVVIALARDGFQPGAPGGQVQLDHHGDPVLDYPLTPALGETFRRAWQTMGELQLAAGARSVSPVHLDARPVTTAAALQRMVADLPWQGGRARVVSAHVMGGCAMSSEPRRGVTDGRGRHHQLQNLSILDGSLFPTSIGANPQLSVYGLCAALADGLARELGG